MPGTSVTESYEIYLSITFTFFLKESFNILSKVWVKKMISLLNGYSLPSTKTNKYSLRKFDSHQKINEITEAPGWCVGSH